MSEPKKMVFQLKKELEYSKSGDFVKTCDIAFAPPNAQCFKEAIQLKQLIEGCCMSMSRSYLSALNLSTEDIEVIKEKEANKPKEASEAVKTSDIKDYIFRASNKDINANDVFDAFKKLACKVGKLDDDTYLKALHFDKLDWDDVIDMTCEYISVFLPPSLS